MSDPVVPILGAESFTCPHCGAVAHQTWYQLYLEGFSKGRPPFVFTRERVLAIDASKFRDEEARERLQKFQARFKKNEITYDVHDSSYLNTALVNAYVSLCYSCDAFTVWINDKIVFPTIKSEIKPSEDLPASLRDDFEEAASVLDLSPRSSAALLRLCIQKLMVELKQKGKDLNADIGALVA
jgi:hypothetical protein